MQPSVLVHGSHLKQKKLTDTKALGITSLNLEQQLVNTLLIWQLSDTVIYFKLEIVG